MGKIYFWCTLIFCFCGISMSLTIVAPECSPPDFPAGGGYGPRQEYYVVGDVIYYYCESKGYIGGNFYRRCQDDGDWTGDTPVCDFPMEILYMNQTTTAEPEDENKAFFASDGDQNTCSSTAPGRNNNWMGIFKQSGELIRVMVFTLQGEVFYEVFLLKSNGLELSCGVTRDSNSPLGWKIHSCPGPNNEEAIGIKIKTLSSKPLQICEIRAHVMTLPICVDPHLHVNYGRIKLTRKTALLVCDNGFTRSPETQIECLQNGVWEEKILYCQEQLRDLGEKENPPDDEP